MQVFLNVLDKVFLYVFLEQYIRRMLIFVFLCFLCGRKFSCDQYSLALAFLRCIKTTAGSISFNSGLRPHRSRKIDVVRAIDQTHGWLSVQRLATKQTDRQTGALWTKLVP